jgi:hypothetical protein
LAIFVGKKEIKTVQIQEKKSKLKKIQKTEIANFKEKRF